MPAAILQEILGLALDAAPWLLLGLVAAGLIKAFAPEPVLRRWIGGEGWGAVGRAAVLGAPLPLCSCGAIPTALALHRAGAGRGPATAFMISTPGIGADSVAVTYALLGPVMMLARVVGALAAAMFTGLAVAAGAGGSGRDRGGAAAGGCRAACAGGTDAAGPGEGWQARLAAGMRYAFDDLLGDIGPAMLGGLVVAGVILWAVPPQAFAGVLAGLPAMLLMAVIGVPVYVCAAAATPVGVAMLLAGASPGTVLVFLLAGPITSLATLAVLRREMGSPTLVRYLVGVVITTVLAGLALDQIVARAGLDVLATMGAGRELVPDWVGWVALAVLALLGLRPLGRAMARLA